MSIFESLGLTKNGAVAAVVEAVVAAVVEAVVAAVVEGYEEEGGGGGLDRQLLSEPNMQSGELRQLSGSL